MRPSGRKASRQGSSKLATVVMVKGRLGSGFCSPALTWAHAPAATRVKSNAAFADFIVPLDAKRNPQIGSTDVGDVSWVVPTAQVHAPTIAIGTPLHTWQVVAQGKSAHAHKAMVQAAKAMASLGIKALTEPALLAAAKADLKNRTARTPYVNPLPQDVSPPLDMSLS